MDNTSEQKTENQEKKKIVRGPRLNQKLKIMYLMKILLEETDEDHDLTLNEIVEKLKAYNVTAERKSLYSDIENVFFTFASCNITSSRLAPYVPSQAK